MPSLQKQTLGASFNAEKSSMGFFLQQFFPFFFLLIYYCSSCYSQCVVFIVRKTFVELLLAPRRTCWDFIYFFKILPFLLNLDPFFLFLPPPYVRCSL
jgi:hypothetical protein